MDLNMDTGRDKTGKFIKGSKVNQGRIPSAAQREKQSVAMAGRVESDEHKANIKAGMLASEKTIGRPKGGIPWNKGRGVKKVRFVNDAKFKKGMVPWNKGLPWSEEVKAKIGAANKGRVLSPEHISKILTRRIPTSLETKFQDIIDKYKLPYKFVGDGSFMIGRKNPDFININGDKIAIEVYAKYYKLRNNETIDGWKKERQRIFAEYGWSLIFFDAMQVNEKNVLKELKGL